MHIKASYIFAGLLAAMYISATLPGFAGNAAAPNNKSRQISDDSPKTSTETIRNHIYRVLKNGDFKQTIEYSHELYEVASREGDMGSMVYAAAQIGASYVHLRERDSSLLYINEAIHIGEENGCHYELATAYNAMGLHILNFGDSDYYLAIATFDKGLRSARKSNNKQTLSVLLGNIAYTYCLRSDPDGLPYALECYELGLAQNDDYLTFIGSFVIAAIHHMTGDFNTALEYILITEDVITPKDPGENISPYKAGMTYTLHGSILLDMDREDEAVVYYRKALAFEDSLEKDELILTYLGYGEYYLRRQEYNAALGMFLKGMEISMEMENKVYNNQFLQKISGSYEKMGDYQNAIHYYKDYYELTGTLYDLEKERSLNELKVQYELEQKEAEITRNKLLLLQQRRKTQVFGMALALIMLALAAVAYFYWKRNKYYLGIVKQSQRAVMAREKLQLERQRASTEIDNVKYANSPLSAEKGQELFDRLEYLMDEGKIYRDKDLNVDKLSELLYINRSYLSRIINEFSGMNFNNYVNKYRVDEAVQILSDVNNDIPLKALASDLGFNTLTTFYNSFQKEIGVPPSQYRKKVLELRKTEIQ